MNFVKIMHFTEEKNSMYVLSLCLILIVHSLKSFSFPDKSCYMHCRGKHLYVCGCVLNSIFEIFMLSGLVFI